MLTISDSKGVGYAYLPSSATRLQLIAKLVQRFALLMPLLNPNHEFD